MADGQAPRANADVRDFFKRWIEGSNAGDWDAVGELMHPDIVYADPMAAEPARGRAEAVRRAQQQYAPFPDGRVDMLGDPFMALGEPELAYRWRFVGTHLRPVDPPGFAPTGRQLRVEGTSVLGFRDRQVGFAVMYFDTTAVARQLLAAPPAGSPLERAMVTAQRLRVRWRRTRR